MTLAKNVGELERFVRINLGLVLLLAVFFAPTLPLKLIGLVGLVPLITSIFEFCPLYTLLGRNPFARTS
ncbi:MAG: DUF2892 domain-containing protein [Pseudomonadota bacterium]